MSEKKEKSKKGTSSVGRKSNREEAEFVDPLSALMDADPEFAAD